LRGTVFVHFWSAVKTGCFVTPFFGADLTAIVYSLVESAKAYDINPYDYFLRVLTSMPLHGKTPANEQLDKLTP